ncbi:MAG: 6,7-dimethyl-8-ribityllumazine synthase [Gemmatimonadaceae bacterium]
MAEFAGTPRGENRRVAVVASRFNGEVTRKLADGAMSALVEYGVAADDIDLVWVPGAWELPTALRAAMAADTYEAVVVVGALIRGETPNFDHLSAAVVQSLAQLAADSEIPVGYALLTCDTDEQAEARAGRGDANKGREAALAALEMADLLDRLHPLDAD